MDQMKRRSRIQKILMALVVSATMSAPPSANAQYQEVEASFSGDIIGQIKFLGDPPEPLFYKLKNFPNIRYCRRISDGRGNRILQEVKVDGDGILQDVAVYLPDIKRGKAFAFNGVDVWAKNCEFLIQGGASTFTGVVKKDSEIRLLNQDADPDDPKLAMGIAHNPHAFEIAGYQIRTMFKSPLIFNGQVLRKKVTLKRNESFVKLECDLHDYMQTYFLPVENPYYAIVGKDGKYKIDGIPPGLHRIIAWHPILGKIDNQIIVGPEGTSIVDFLFTK